MARSIRPKFPEILFKVEWNRTYSEILFKNFGQSLQIVFFSGNDDSRCVDTECKMICHSSSLFLSFLSSKKHEDLIFWKNVDWSSELPAGICAVCINLPRKFRKFLSSHENHLSRSGKYRGKVCLIQS